MGMTYDAMPGVWAFFVEQADGRGVACELKGTPLFHKTNIGHALYMVSRNRWPQKHLPEASWLKQISGKMQPKQSQEAGLLHGARLRGFAEPVWE